MSNITRRLRKLPLAEKLEEVVVFINRELLPFLHEAKEFFLSDGDKGDITVSDNGATWELNDESVTNDTLALMEQSTIKLRPQGAGPGEPIDGTATQVLNMIGFTRGSIVYRGASLWQELTAGTSGKVLHTQGSGADPEWDWPSPVINVLTANDSVTNDVTNITFTSYTVDANDWSIGTLFRLTGWFVFVHAAGATPNLVAELLVQGAVVATATIAPAAGAFTRNGCIEAILCCRTLGTPGTAKADLQFRTSVGVDAASNLFGSVDTADFNLTTTSSRTISLRVRMATAVAANTLTGIQGYTERLRS